MNVIKVDHIGIAVKSIAEAAKFWEDTLGLKIAATEEVAEQKVITAFIPCGDSEVELLQATAEDSPIAKFIENKGEGIQHIALRVDNIEEALSELNEKEVRLIDEVPRKGAGGARIAFLHPKATGGVLLELCQR
ncbi:MAG: methylmalonyl-CoA epimerase [Clostridiales bacterium]|nr:methylmalonyl-CoA epimerase [Clostridiales bacterium]